MKNNKPSRIEFLIKIEEYKDRLPSSIIPFLLAKNPSLKKNRVRNILKGITIDEKIFKELDVLCKFLNV
jgi:hypothetical protein